MPGCPDEVDADGFTKVAPKFRYKAPVQSAKARKSRKGKPAAAQPAAGVDADGQGDDEAAQVGKVRDVIEGRRKLLQYGSWAESWEVLVQSLQDDPAFPRPTSIVCFGLGSLIQSRIAQLQLLLMLDLAVRFEIKQLSAFDPAFVALDTPLLASYGVSVMTENTHGRHPLPTDGQEATIVYMPHCPRTLYHNVLASNWSPEQLGRVVLIANELDGYVTRDPLPKLRKIAPCVPLVVPHLACRLVPTQFHYNDVYNDLAIQWVAAADVAKIGEAGWKAPEAEVEGAGDEVL